MAGLVREALSSNGLDLLTRVVGTASSNGGLISGFAYYEVGRSFLIHGSPAATKWSSPRTPGWKSNLPSDSGLDYLPRGTARFAPAMMRGTPIWQRMTPEGVRPLTTAHAADGQSRRDDLNLAQDVSPGFRSSFERDSPARDG